jgi:pyruvate kinase
LISKYRPNAEIFGFSYLPGVCNRMNLLWGLHPVVVDHTPAVEDMVSGAEYQLMKANACTPGDVVGIVAGTRTTSGSTNFMRLHMVGSGDDLQAGKSAHNRVIAEKRKKTIASKNGRKRVSVKA